MDERYECKSCAEWDAQCVLCRRPLHNGERLVAYEPRPGALAFAHQVHASCAQELRGEAEG